MPADRKTTDRFPALPSAIDGSRVETTHPHPNLILTRLMGLADEVMAERMRGQVLSKLGNAHANLIVDATEVERCDDSLRNAFLNVLEAFKQRGGGRVLIAVKNPSVRMVLSGIAMTSPLSGGPRIELVDSLDIAHIRLETKEDA